jgi:hypothetical protein
MGAGGVALSFLRSTEYQKARVMSYYHYFLQRHDPWDAEVNHWVAAALDVRSIRIAFESSREYFGRGGPPLDLDAVDSFAAGSITTVFGSWPGYFIVDTQCGIPVI